LVAFAKSSPEFDARTGLIRARRVYAERLTLNF
jgi:hypothetical protein